MAAALPVNNQATETLGRLVYKMLVEDKLHYGTYQTQYTVFDSLIAQGADINVTFNVDCGINDVQGNDIINGYTLFDATMSIIVHNFNNDIETKVNLISLFEYFGRRQPSFDRFTIPEVIRTISIVLDRARPGLYNRNHLSAILTNFLNRGAPFNKTERIMTIVLLSDILILRTLLYNRHYNTNELIEEDSLGYNREIYLNDLGYLLFLDFQGGVDIPDLANKYQEIVQVTGSNVILFRSVREHYPVDQRDERFYIPYVRLAGERGLRIMKLDRVRRVPPPGSDF